MCFKDAYTNTAVLLDPLDSDADLMDVLRTATTIAEPLAFETVMYELVQKESDPQPMLYRMEDEIVDTITFIPLGLKRLGPTGSVYLMEGYIVDSSELAVTVRAKDSNAVLDGVQLYDKSYAAIIYDAVAEIATIDYFICGGYKVKLQPVDSLYPQLVESLPMFPEQLNSDGDGADPCVDCDGCGGYEEGMECGEVNCPGCTGYDNTVDVIVVATPAIDDDEEDFDDDSDEIDEEDESEDDLEGGTEE